MAADGIFLARPDAPADGISLAVNEIANQVQAYVANANNQVKTTSGGITVQASESATIDAFSLAASLAGPAPASLPILPA